MKYFLTIYNSFFDTKFEDEIEIRKINITTVQELEKFCEHHFSHRANIHVKRLEEDSAKLDLIVNKLFWIFIGSILAFLAMIIMFTYA